jgi:hypothetical protein
MTRTTAATHAIPTVGAVLAPIHDRWTDQVRSFVLPATDIHAGFWNRWGAARFLSDRFNSRFRLECALADELAALIGPEAATRLSAVRAKVESALAELMAVGRRRGVGGVTAGLAGRFLEDLGRWWVELEIATAQVDCANLPPGAGRLLGRLRPADELAE